MKQFDVYPECNVDTNLVGFIIGGHVKHKSSCNEVVKAVNGADSFAIGIIDEDKRRATLDEGFRICPINSIKGKKCHVSMYIHDDCKRFIFTIKPAMDKFIFDAVKAQGVDLTEVGFLPSFDGFKKETKKIQAATDPRLRRLLVLIADYPELMRLRNTLKYLLAKQYEVDPDIAIGFYNGSLGIDDLKQYLVNK